MLTNLLVLATFSELSRQIVLRLVPLTLLTVLLAAATAHGQRVWVQHGPGPNTAGQVENITDGEVGGAIHAVATHPTNADIIYVATVNGGIWKTTNATATNPTWVEQLGLNRSLSLGAIAFDPTDATNETLMAGSGRFSNSAGRGGDRVGAWRTTNGGTTWTLLDGGGTIAGLNITGVAPRGTILVVSANTANTLANRGIWRSDNTGAVWTQISGGVGTGLPTGASFDLASDPSNNARLFTNAGANGIFRSEDTGAIWNKVSDVAVDAALVGASNVKIAVGTSNNVYVAIVNGGTGRLSGLFRSGDGGDSWTALDLPTTTELGVPVGIHPGGQGGVNLSIVADPTNANVVYLGGDSQPSPLPNSIGANDFSGRLFRVNASLAAGTQASHITHSNTTSSSAPHADSRDMAFDAAGNLIETDDGGIYRRTTPLNNTGDWFSLIGNLIITELKDVAWDSVAKTVIGGAQDTGTPEQVISGNIRWRSVSTADGGDVAVNDTGVPDTSIRYSSNQFLSLFRRRTLDSSNTVLSTVFPALTLVGGGAALVPQFTTPIAVNRVTPTRLIIGGGNSVYESLDQGDTITEIGPGIPVNSAATDPIAYGATGNADMLYIGSGDDVFVRTAALPAALAASATYLGNGTGRLVRAIVMDPGDPQIAYVADNTNVYRTPDAGGTWVNITGDLLGLTPGNIHSITFSTANAAGTVVVGTNNGVYGAPGPAFTDWEPVADGLPRAPVYDLEYDVVDQVLVASLLGRGAWTVNLSERNPVDVALVLDLSGSMLSPACGTCDPKLQVLKDSVELFVQLWTAFTVPNDRMAVNYFRTNISEFTVGPDALVPFQPNAGTIITDVQGQTTVGANLTAMGGGLQTAINRLTDATRPRHIILFTDGMQNVNPMVNTTTFEIADQPGRPASGVAATMPPTDLNAALGMRVNTIGVGATPAFVDLLDDIASETTGLFKLTNAPDEDLRKFYVEELVDVLRDFSPQLLAYRYGTLPSGGGTEAFVTNGSTRRVVFKVSWKRGAQMNFAVLKDGVDVTRLGRIVNGPFYKIFSLDVPNSRAGITSGGNWELRLDGTKGSKYEAAAIVEEEKLKYEFAIAGSGRVVGDPLPFTVRLTFAGQPVTNAVVTAQVLAPREALSNLLSTRRASLPTGFQSEPGATDAQRKFQFLLGQTSFVDALKPLTNPITFQNNNNGTYSATFTNTSVSGPYTVIFKVEGQRTDIGNYARTESRSVTLRFGTPQASASNLSLRSDRGTHQLSVRPVDTRGNYLGPDYGHAIAVTVNGVRVTTSPHDALDGSYIFPIVTSQPLALTNVVVTVMGRPLYNGPLSGISTTGQSRFAFSAHTGVAIPLRGFGSAAGTGLLTEFDFEFRATPTFSLEGVYGRYDFQTPGEIHSGSLFLKKYFPAGSWRAYLSGGPGVFKPQGGSARFGLTGGAGLNKPVNSWLEVDFGVQYSHVFAPTDAGFLGVKGGVKVTF